MPFVQFRVHPGVGCARMGNSTKAYHLASEFPQFMQEEFPNLRFKPKPRQHPRAFFDGLPDSDLTASGTLANFEIYGGLDAFQNKFKEAEGLIFPQAARFRVFAYVYATDEAPHPDKVFEVTTEIADIEWKVNIANKKSKKTTAPAADPFANKTNTSSDLDTKDVTLTCKRVRPVAGLPNLAYLFLERDDADKSKVTGRLHVIGNEGELIGTTDPHGLWSDDWYDSAGDGSVEAFITPKGGGDMLRNKAGASNVAALKYLEYGFADAQEGSTETIRAMPGWVVVGCPDYVPDMGHFVSLWDVGFSRGLASLDSKPTQVLPQAGKHKLIEGKTKSFDDYLTMDYHVHIHPQLCLFQDVRFVSGDAIGEPDTGPQPRAHNKHPGTSPPTTATDIEKKVEHGGVVIKAREKKADYANPLRLKSFDPAKPINDWLKVAIYKRLRKPGGLYDKRRKFLVRLPGSAEGNAGNTREDGIFPRKIGRRMDYDMINPGPDIGLFYRFPHYEYPPGNLREFHGHPDKGKLCGGATSPKKTAADGTTLVAPDEAVEDSIYSLLGWLDDMYWPATFADMPMLRELAYTHLQYDHFAIWQGSKKSPAVLTLVDHDVRNGNILGEMLSTRLKTSFAGAGDADKHFATFLGARPKYAPAMIDMAHLGAMLGGSFLPGIEVGREAGVPKNWALFQGGTKFFPSIRFKRVDIEEEHTVGTLTKDLAIPWSKDYSACDESFWPTARPGIVSKNDIDRYEWMPEEQVISADPDEAEPGVVIPHLGHVARGVEYVKEYWKSLGFVRRTADDKFLVAE